MKTYQKILYYLWFALSTGLLSRSRVKEIKILQIARARRLPIPTAKETYEQYQEKWDIVFEEFGRTGLELEKVCSQVGKRLSEIDISVWDR